MIPSKVPVTHLFNTPYQYQVPVFQRGYVWSLTKQVAPLWADIQDRAHALQEHDAHAQEVGVRQLKPLQKHFLGSIVLTPITNAFGRVNSFEVIDGQQRTTTLHLLILAFKHAAKMLPNSSVEQMLSVLARNPGPYTLDTDHHKVWPTKAGRQELAFLNSVSSPDEVCATYPVKDGKLKLERPLMVQAYLYLYHACLAFLQDGDLEDAIDPSSERTHGEALVDAIQTKNQVTSAFPGRPLIQPRAELLYTTLDKHVQLMTLTLDQAEDDPQVIFETLNARGEPLLASDLIRNFVFLEAARRGASVPDLYATYWQSFDEEVGPDQAVRPNRYWRVKERQGRLLHPRLDLFFFHYTGLRSLQGTLVTHVFQSFKEWWQSQPRELSLELARIGRASGHFREFISPTGTDYLSEFARLVKSLEVSTVTPLYLVLRERLEVRSPQLKQAISDLASYLARRAVCGWTSKGYNRIFLKIAEAVDSSADPVSELREQLLKLGGPSQAWPTDGDFQTAWMRRAVYKEMRPGKVSAILRALEWAAHGSLQGHSEVPAQTALTVEHVLPQGWEESGHYDIPNVTEAGKAVRNHAVQTFGNLTLLTQPLNSSSSNGPFSDLLVDGEPRPGKRTKLGLSTLLINTYFHQQGIQTWDEDAIAARARNLFAAAIEVWARPAQLETNARTVLQMLSGAVARS